MYIYIYIYYVYKYIYYVYKYIYIHTHKKEHTHTETRTHTHSMNIGDLEAALFFGRSCLPLPKGKDWNDRRPETLAPSWLNSAGHPPANPLSS